AALATRAVVTVYADCSASPATPPLGSSRTASRYCKARFDIWRGARRMLTLRDVLSAPPRDNAEGYVIWLDERTAIKFKYEAYMALHRIVSNLTVKEVWRQLRDGTFEEFAAALPDEFHDWAKREQGVLVGDYDEVLERVDARV